MVCYPWRRWISARNMGELKEEGFEWKTEEPDMSTELWFPDFSTNGTVSARVAMPDLFSLQRIIAQSVWSVLILEVELFYTVEPENQIWKILSSCQWDQVGVWPSKIYWASLSLNPGVGQHDWLSTWMKASEQDSSACRGIVELSFERVKWWYLRWDNVLPHYS